MTSPSGSRVRAWVPTLQDIGEALLTLVTTTLGLAVAVWLIDGVRADNPGAIVLAALVVAVGEFLLGAPLRFLARRGSAVLALGLGLLAQVAVLWIALALVPGIDADNVWDVLGVLILTAIVMAIGRWMMGANDSDYVISVVVRRARRQARRRGVTEPGSGEPRSAGMLVVQLDGVAAPVLREAIEAGLAPNIQRWMTNGDHVLEDWWARIPSTTPASQAGLLHGDSGQIPAFRWWDRDLGRLVVTNHPEDAALVEQRLSNGKGLLAGGGSAVSTMFSGDAATAFVVMSRSRTKGPDGGLGPGPAYVRFFASPFVLARAVTVSVGEMLKELYQARRQRVRDVLPRISRAGWYVVLRGISNVLLRDLNTSLVAEALLRGDPTIYVDLVDYDEIAHHAGPTRPESLRSLEGLDRVLGTLERVVAVAPRDYEIVVLSDHGQALGATYEQLGGETLLDTVRSLMAEPDAAGVDSATGEDWGPLNALVNSALNLSHGSAVLGPDQGRPKAQDADDLPDVVTVGSGNLGLVWFPQVPQRLTLEDFQARWPGLVTGLAARPGVGVVVVDTADRGLVAIGPRGLVLLEQDDAEPEGEDPLLPYGPRGRPDLMRAARLPHTGDLLLISTVGETGHVHAFEGQVGSHGGIGGAQNHAFLLHPSRWVMDDELREPVGDDEILVGAESVHEQLIRWAAAAGLRPVTVRFRWLGHASAVLDLDGARLLTDPLLLRHAGLLRRRGATPDREHWTGAAAVLLSHLHHDHAELGSLRQLPGTPVLTAPANARWLRGRGIAGAEGLAETQWWDVPGGQVRVRLVPAVHVHRPMPHRPNAANGFLITSPTYRVWFAGDTSPFGAMSDLPALAGGPIDLALIPVGGWGPRLSGGHMDPVQAVRACVAAGARHAVPVHWGTLHAPVSRRLPPGWMDRAGPAFAAAAAREAPDLRVHVVTPGEQIELA